MLHCFHRKMVSPQNGDTRGGPPPSSDATDCIDKIFSRIVSFLLWSCPVPKLAPPEPPNRGGASHKKGAPK